MEHTMMGALATHLPRHKLDLYLELCNKWNKVSREAKTDVSMNKLKHGKGSEKTAECFRYLREMKNQEAAALKTLENYLKKDGLQHPDHHHKKDLATLSKMLSSHHQ